MPERDFARAVAQGPLSYVGCAVVASRFWSYGDIFSCKPNPITLNLRLSQKL